MRNPRRAYTVVDQFEHELEAYTDAPHAVAVNSCTNAIFLALTWERMQGVEGPIMLPRHTYIGVLQAAINAGYDVDFTPHNWHWKNMYDLNPTRVVDAARTLTPHTYEPGRHTCLSFHAAKQLPIGRGGAILTDNPDAADWYRAARMDGRPPGSDTIVFPGWHMPMAPDTAARGLDILSRWNDTGYTPPPLPPTDYPDLSAIYQKATA